jgi:putative membrane protein
MKVIHRCLNSPGIVTLAASMDLRYILAVLHILTFGLGAASCWARARALWRLNDSSGLKEVFLADNVWGLSALLWLATGLWRAFGGVEKGTDFYLSNTAFLIKMTLFAAVFLLEIRPMVTLIIWRIRQAKGQHVDMTSARTLANISYLELFLLVPIVMMAAAMARGIWY